MEDLRARSALRRTIPAVQLPQPSAIACHTQSAGESGQAPRPTSRDSLQQHRKSPTKLAVPTCLIIHCYDDYLGVTCQTFTRNNSRAEDSSHSLGTERSRRGGLHGQLSTCPGLCCFVCVFVGVCLLLLVAVVNQSASQTALYQYTM